MVNRSNNITIEEAIEYVSNFGGYNKAYRRKGFEFFLTYEEYLYHKECLMLFINYHNH